MQIKIKGKLAFPSVYTPTTFNGEGAAQFKAICILEANDPQVVVLDQTTDQVGSEKWTNKWASVKKELLQRDKTFVHDGDLKSHLDGFAGRKFISASSKVKPTVVNFDRTPLDESSGRPYGGCICNFLIDVWAQDNQFGKRINAKLLGVQFVEDGPAFGSGPAANADHFDELPAPKTGTDGSGLV